MREHEFEYGPLSKGTLLALVSVTPVIALYFPDEAPYYLALLVFLVIGLRPLLERTGLYRNWASIEVAISERWNRKHLKKRRMEIDRKIRDEKYRKSRVRDPRLPRNW